LFRFLFVSRASRHAERTSLLLLRQVKGLLLCLE
jgi:hypothetical protein